MGRRAAGTFGPILQRRLLFLCFLQRQKAKRLIFRRGSRFCPCSHCGAAFGCPWGAQGRGEASLSQAHIPASQGGTDDLCSLCPWKFSYPVPPDSPHLKFLGCPQTAPYHSGMLGQPTFLLGEEQTASHCTFHNFPWVSESFNQPWKVQLDSWCAQSRRHWMAPCEARWGELCPQESLRGYPESWEQPYLWNYWRSGWTLGLWDPSALVANVPASCSGVGLDDI